MQTSSSQLYFNMVEIICRNQMIVLTDKSQTLCCNMFSFLLNCMCQRLIINPEGQFVYFITIKWDLAPGRGVKFTTD